MTDAKEEVASLMDHDFQETKEPSKADIKETKEETVESLDDSPIPEGDIQLESKDKKEFTVVRKHAYVSTLVKTTLEQDKEAIKVPLPGVSAATLARVIEYMSHHKGTEPSIIPKPLRNKEMKQVCPDPWDATYIDKIGEIRQDLYDLILAANYLDIKALLHLGCAKVASLIKGQPLEKIKEILTQGMSKEEKDGKSSK
jgi:S-phase kinase-associated protein 1